MVVWLLILQLNSNSEEELFKSPTEGATKQDTELLLKKNLEKSILGANIFVNLIHTYYY